MVEPSKCIQIAAMHVPGEDAHLSHRLHLEETQRDLDNALRIDWLPYPRMELGVQRAPSGRIRGTEYRHARHAQCVGQVGRAAVVANEQGESFDHGGKRTEPGLATEVDERSRNPAPQFGNDFHLAVASS